LKNIFFIGLERLYHFSSSDGTRLGLGAKAPKMSLSPDRETDLSRIEKLTGG